MLRSRPGYFYDVQAIWVDLDQNRQPTKLPVLSAWALPEDWRKGMRPQRKNGNGKANTETQGKGSNAGNSVTRTKALSRASKGNSGNDPHQAGYSDNSAATSDDELDQRILGMEKALGTAFYRNILREYGRVNQPKLIRDAATKQKVLQMMESAARGIDRLEAITKRINPSTMEDMLAKLQAPPLGSITDIKTLQRVVLGLEELAG